MLLLGAEAPPSRPLAPCSLTRSSLAQKETRQLSKLDWLKVPLRLRSVLGKTLLISAGPAFAKWPHSLSFLSSHLPIFQFTSFLCFLLVGVQAALRKDWGTVDLPCILTSRCRFNKNEPSCFTKLIHKTVCSQPQ